MTLALLTTAELALVVLVMLGMCLAAETDIPTVPAGHPRVYLRPDDLPHLRDKVATPEFQGRWEEVRAKAADTPVCAAFVYLVTGDKVAGRSAVEGGLAALKASDDARTFEEPFHWAACVYDWCYDLLTPAEK